MQAVIFMNVNLDEPVSLENQKFSPFLTPREKEVLEHIAESLTNQQIAHQSIRKCPHD
jgi:DNA-binding NarL/FixJ family response regulator